MTTARYPAKAAQALGFLKSHSNDVDIYVEDTGAPSMWLKLIRKYLPAGTKIKSVTPLGGRKEVIKACKADQAARPRRRIYIIDADMDLLTSRGKPKLKYLYRLRRYCVENYLLSQKALKEVFMSLNPNLSEERALSVGDVDVWLAINEKRLRSIFTAYAVSEHLSIGAQTVAYSCHRLFLDKVDYHFCTAKVGRRVAAIYKDAIAIAGIADVRSVFDAITKTAKSKPVIEICSAKAYIMPALYEKAKRGVGFSVSLDSFKTMLSDHADASIDPYLMRRLRAL
ncbi:MAG: hypothetical protein JWS10_80 [Cypionkella sp.]|uniref:DUF4435 domain-containing protein n=1 Tax=Cypionkella sp. TaxID=2811411 RepID=UPI00263424C4|nr:DUF4435 domain-containing protein [Cypionkella sp.]MDB5657465.1 hypothetical protein [Cypionkella sp.]